MTTVAPLGGASFPGNETAMSTEDFLYKSSGAIVAAIVVGVIIIFTVVLILLKMYNRKMRMRRELEPKSPKPTAPASPTGQPSNNSVSQPTTVTFIPVDIHMENR
ncbi:noncompact myelin-associated protein [Antechinus flavipes]|nr:noncompact myelin-associated protein [Antechinus flavipes]